MIQQDTNNVPGTLLSELFPSSPWNYVFYYYLYFRNEKTEIPRIYMIYPKSES